MSELVQMRQRIKAIETIKKITHAMRLISMSSQLRLKSKHKKLATYIASIDTLFFKIQAASPSWQHPVINPAPTKESKKLIILIGSQKGLCGNFNNLLFKTFTKHIDASGGFHNLHIVAVGKKAVDFCKEHAAHTLIKIQPTLNMHVMPTVAHELISTITHAPEPYQSVAIWSNKLKTFFIQQPHETTLIPLNKQKNSSNTPPNTAHNYTEEYTWHQDANQILNTLATQYINAHVYQALFDSLLAEHAARFISMDSSTRNADNLLEANKLAYNKARQAKITKELTELSSSF